jgi:adenylate cyclase class 2
MKTGSGVETEVKLIGAGDAAGLRARLRAAGARLQGERGFETNALFDDAGESLRRSGRLLRLRNAGELTVKLPMAEAAAGGGFKSRREITAEVASGPIQELLEGLGYRVTWRYEKWREGWDLDGVWVTIDELPFVGTVVELEGEPAGIEAALARLELGGAERSNLTYRDLYERFAAEHGLPPGDMTFAAEGEWRSSRA